MLEDSPDPDINVRDLFSLWAPLCSINFSDIDCYADLEVAFQEELDWLKIVTTCFLSTGNNNLFSGWAQHHVSYNRGLVHLPGINTILPLLGNKVNTLQMQSHCMMLNVNSIQVLNPDQTPVDVSDQSVYALSKELQFRYPDIFGDYVPSMGALHIEQSLLVIEILNQHKFTSIGLSAVVDVNNTKRARYCVQITLCVLYSLLDNSMLPAYEWLRLKSKSNQMCFIWKVIMDILIQILIFVRSIRAGDVLLFTQVLTKLMKWYFIFDHVHYARWLSVHLFDLLTLHVKYPDVYSCLLRGSFVFQKSSREFHVLL